MDRLLRMHPYISAGLPWPKTASGRSMALIAQFNFTNSTDIVGKLPGDLLLVFGDNSDGPIDPLHFEWQNLRQADLVTKLPTDSMAISPCFGNRCRTVSFPIALPWHLPHRLYQPDPIPLLTLWSGRILGVILPVGCAFVFRRNWIWFVANFCMLLANVCDDKPNGDIRVTFSINDGRSWRAFVPVTESFIIAPNSPFIDG